MRKTVLVVGTCCGCAGFGVIGGLVMSETIGLLTWFGLWAVQMALIFVSAALDRKETNRFLRVAREDMHRADVIALQAAYEQCHLHPEMRIH